MAEERSFVVLRRDGLLLHTVPVTYNVAWWLHLDIYYGVESRAARVRYLEEYGNVLDVGEYVERLCAPKPDICHRVVRIYESPDDFAEEVAKLLGRGDLPPEARRALGGLLGAARDFLARPVEPRPIASPARYFEAPSMDVAPGPGGVSRARLEWLLYGEGLGVSVFRDSFWLWARATRLIGVGSLFRALVVRRDASDEDVIAALAGDEEAARFVGAYADDFRQLVGGAEDELRERGYADVVRRAKVILTTAALLTAGRREEEGEALPA